MIEFILREDNPLLNSWSYESWSYESCSVEKGVNDGKFYIVDHNIQTTIAVADTEQEAREWLGLDNTFQNPEMEKTDFYLSSSMRNEILDTLPTQPLIPSVVG